MLKLLLIEWLKIRRYRTFWILAGLFAILLFFWNWFIGTGIISMGNGNFNVLNSAYTFPAVWPTIGHWTKVFSGLIAIIVIILSTNEYQFRTNRQNVIDGWQRLQFFHAKWLVVVSLSVAVTLYTFIMGIFFSLHNGSQLAGAATGLIKLLHVFIMTINYFGFALTLSFLLKRSGITIIIFLLYGYIIEIMLQQLLNWKFSYKPGNYLPLQCSAELLGLQILNSLKAMMPGTGPTENMLMLVSVGWVAVYYILGRWLLLRSDI
ncbi:MAG: ABC transporter permease [Taibaiella sp.]|nr:ABC transporter permease [Taibaiella sp.]